MSMNAKTGKLQLTFKDKDDNAKREILDKGVGYKKVIALIESTGAEDI